MKQSDIDSGTSNSCSRTVVDPGMNNGWSWVQETFNNRGIATGIWVLIAFISCLLLRDVRTGIGYIIKACFQTKHTSGSEGRSLR